MHSGDMHSPARIDGRIPVWTALSELFLDTQLEDSDIDRIVRILVQSGLSRKELEGILRDEVAPAFGSNLRSVAGRWTAWPDAEVQAMVERSIERRSREGWAARFNRLFASKKLPADWPRIAAMLP